MLHCYRLDPAIDAEDMQLIRDLFAGGESRRMGPNSIAVRIEDTRSQNTPDTFQSLQSGNHHNVSVRVSNHFKLVAIYQRRVWMQSYSFSSIGIISCAKPMHKSMKKSQDMFHDPRVFIKSNLSTIFMCEQSIESMLADPSVLYCIQKQFFVKAYRCIIPLLWEIKNEWLLIIIDPSTNSVHTIYPKYTTDVVQGSSGDERVANSIVLRDKLSAIVSASPSRSVNQPQGGGTNDQQQPLQTTPESNIVPWQFYFTYNSSGTHDTFKDNINNRTPDGMDCGVCRHHDSGIYILHAMECDYYDCPIFNTITEDWNIIRIKLSHCVLNKQLIL